MIEVKNLKVVYGNKVAVNGISFNIEKGEIFGIIGENGAGKTTTIECIEGIRKPTEGFITISGLNPQKDNNKVQSIIGVQLQETSYPKRMKVKEVCELFTALYKNTRDYNELLEEFGLLDHKKKYVENLSGGQKQRLSIILALIHNPKIVFLDELTTGLDPRSRRGMWDYIYQLKENGVTVVMTTHFMEEAEYLCDRVAIFNEGNIVALDTVPTLIKSLPYEEKASFIVKKGFNVDILNDELINEVIQRGKEVTAYGKHGVSKAVKDILDNSSYDYLRFRSSLPTLEDVFFINTEDQGEE